MTGMRYHRLRQHFTQEALGRRAHLSRYRIAQMESEEPTGKCSQFEYVAKVLGVTISELLEDVDQGKVNSYVEDAKLGPGENPYNAISHFRIDYGLSYRALSKIIYCTDEVAKAACLAESSPNEHVEILARTIGLTPQGFLEIYREGELM